MAPCTLVVPSAGALVPQVMRELQDTARPKLAAGGGAEEAEGSDDGRDRGDVWEEVEALADDGSGSVASSGADGVAEQQGRGPRTERERPAAWGASATGGADGLI